MTKYKYSHSQLKAIFGILKALASDLLVFSRTRPEYPKFTFDKKIFGSVSLFWTQFQHFHKNFLQLF